MTTFIGIYALILRGVQLLFVAAAAALAMVALLDWLVRTRRISPFSGIARFARRTVDPLLAPVERRILRSGGSPTNAPWWALAAVVVLGIVVISLLQFLGGQIVAMSRAAQAGPRGILLFLVGATFAVLQVALIVRVVASWIPALSPYSPWVRWAFTLTEPILRPLRQVIPQMGPVDITPIAAYFLIRIVEWLVMGMLR